MTSPSKSGRPAPFFTERKAVLFFLKDSAALFLSEPREETSPIPVMTQRFTGTSGFFPDTGGPGRVGGHVAEGYVGRGISERGGDAGGTAGAEPRVFFENEIRRAALPPVFLEVGTQGAQKDSVIVHLNMKLLGYPGRDFEQIDGFAGEIGEKPGAFPEC